MFTGIITDVGRVSAVAQRGDTAFTLATAYDTREIAEGASIACAGCCLTVIEKGDGWFVVQASAETLSRTTLGRWREGTPVNLERALRLGDELGGHIVSGHVDAVAEIVARRPEGDIIIPAQMATPEAINFMAKHGRGLVCLALTRQRVEQLGLPLMPQLNASRLQTAFTVSIEAREGVTTGISAPDRARTVAVAIDASKGPQDIVTPGHVFPLLARDGGVLVRTGHTEAAVDLARLAGLNPSGVICEIMNDDGTMARRPELIAFAQRHGLKIATIADLIAYRRRHDRIIERRLETPFHSRFGGEFKMRIYANKISDVEHIALVKGDIATPEPVLVRMHALNVLEDVLGHDKGNRGGLLQGAMEAIGRAGRGVVVLIREPVSNSWSDRVPVLMESKRVGGAELRNYGVGAQILLDLGIRDMVLLSNTRRTIVGLEGYGLAVVGQQPIERPGGE